MDKSGYVLFTNREIPVAPQKTAAETFDFRPTGVL